MKNQPRSASIYSSLVLRLYDFWVLQISNTCAWRCPTKRYLLPFFKKFLSQHHLDVGVGTGFYPANGMKSGNLTLLDSNQNCLHITQTRCKDVPDLTVTPICHDIFQPFAVPVKFDSISLFYLLHCLPGTMDEKETVIANLKENLAHDGVLYGATILGDSQSHNWMGRKLMQIYNQKGIFGNADDTAEALTRILRRHFASVSVQVIGRVALFSAHDKT